MHSVDLFRWHYPRPGFTQTVFQSMVGGGCDAYRFFGPRRIGKTQFLRYDLGVRAFAAGHRAVYVSFWQNIDSPLETLAQECARAIGERSLKDSALNWLAESRLKIEARHGPVTASIENSGKPPAARDLWGRLTGTLDRLTNPAKPAFLFLDEFQAVAPHKESRAILDRLRVELTRRQAGLKVIFTGSSQRELRTIFAKDAAGPGAFYEFAPLLELPDLDVGFVDHQLAMVRQEFHREVPKDEAVEVFVKDCDSKPQMFREWLLIRKDQPTSAKGEVLQKMLFDAADRQAFHAAFRNLAPRARIMARLVAEGVRQPRGQIGADWWRNFAATPAPSPAQRGTDLKTLLDQDVIYRRDVQKDYAMSDPHFGKWLQMKPKSDFQIKSPA